MSNTLTDQSFAPPHFDRTEFNSNRNELIFAPYIPSHAEGGRSPNYDHLFGQEDLSNRNVEDAAVRTPEGRGVETHTSIEYSMDILKRFENEAGLDSKIKEIIGRHNGNNLLASKETIQNIRSNKDLRMELGSYFLSKLDNMRESLPPRVARNEQKNSTFVGYAEIPNLRSREYTSLLAIAHLDGTFDPDKSVSEKPTYDVQGGVVTGQHRAACEMLLFW